MIKSEVAARKEFAKSRRKDLVLKELEGSIRVRLEQVLFSDPDRIDHYDRYQETITAYNAEQDRANALK